MYKVLIHLRTMSKGEPYPLRLDPKLAEDVAKVAAETGLTQAAVLRMALKVGFHLVDWEKYQKPILKADRSSQLATLNEPGITLKEPSLKKTDKAISYGKRRTKMKETAMDIMHGLKQQTDKRQSEDVAQDSPNTNSSQSVAVSKGSQ